jgi:hypothetical protein
MFLPCLVSHLLTQVEGVSKRQATRLERPPKLKERLELAGPSLAASCARTVAELDVPEQRRKVAGLSPGAPPAVQSIVAVIGR